MLRKCSSMFADCGEDEVCFGPMVNNGDRFCVAEWKRCQTDDDCPVYGSLFGGQVTGTCQFYKRCRYNRAIAIARQG